MGSSGSAPEPGREETVAVFQRREPCTPLATAEVATELDRSPGETRSELSELAEVDRLRTRELPDGTNVWWRPAALADQDAEADSQTDDETTDDTSGDASDSTFAADEFQTFVRAVTDYAIFTLDPDGIVSSWNEGARRIKGYESDEIVGEHFRAFYTDEDAAAGVPERNLRRAAEEGRVEDEGWRVRADGSEFWANVVITAIRGDDGELRGFTKVTRDMTERREYEQQLRRERDQTEQLLRTAPVAITVQNADGDTILANERAQAAIGDTDVAFSEYPAATDEWTLADEQGSPLDREQTPWARALATGESVFDEIIVFELDDGQQRQFRVNATPLRDDEGQIDRIVTVGDDVTELKRRERQLERRKSELETELSEILGRVSDAFYALDEEWRFTHINEEAADIVGRSPEALFGRVIWDVFPEDTEDSFRERFSTAMETQEPVSFEVEAPEFEAWLEVNVYPSESGLSVYFRDVTDRKERERELRAMERRFQATFEDPNILVGLLDPDGTVRDINQTAMAYVDADLAELRGEPFWETPWWGLGDDVQDDVREWVERAAAGEYVDFEADLTRPNGECYTLEGVFRPVTNDDGEVVSVIVSDRDVTERVKREHQLEQSERRYRTLAEYFPNGIVTLFDDDLVYELAAGQGFADIPVTPDDLEGHHVTESWDAETAEILQPQFEAALDGEEQSIELEYVGRDWVVHAVPITDERGDVFAGMTMAQDITERKERERALREREQRIARQKEYTDAIIDAIDDVFYVLGEDGQLKRWNESLVDLAGYPVDEMTSMDTREFFVSDDREAAVATIQEGFETGSTSAELTVETGNGERIPFEFSASTVEAPDGETVLAGIGRDVSDRVARERALEESERRYRTLAQNFPGAVGVFDRDLRYTLAEGAKLGTDLPPAERLEGSLVTDVFPEETVSDLEPLFRAAVEDGATDSTTTQFGGRIWRVWTAPLVDADGEIFAGLSLAQDVTEQVERTEQLTRYETIVETVTDGVYVVDDEGHFTMVNEAYAAMLDYEPEDLVGAHVSTVVSEATHQQARKLEADAVDGDGDMPTLEAQLETAGGETFPAEANFAMLPEGDNAWHRVGIVRDVSDRKARERELEQRARQQEVVANLGQFALEVDDLDELMHEASRQVADVLDNAYSKVLDLDDDRRELLLRQGVGWRDGIVGQATVDADENSQAGYTLLSEEPVVVEDLATEDRFAGPELLTSHDVTSGVSTIIGSIENPWGILGTHDTERREFTTEDVNFVKSVANVLAEAIERHRYQRDLEALVADLEASNERLEQFAYAASHDLQEPLRMVSSYLQLVEGRYAEDLDAEGQEFIEFAVDGAERMREMIDGLLEYSRVDTRGDPFEPVELDAVLADVREDLRVKIDESDAEIRAGSLPRVEGDAGQLRQVFQNLLDNAIEYSGEAPPEIEISAERAGDRFRLSVRDEGIGIGPDDTDRVFEVFQRLHTHDEHEGTGIGLALCRRIVERHGGELTVESTPGDHTTFTFTLPVPGESNE